jgi:hypothetical protein
VSYTVARAFRSSPVCSTSCNLQCYGSLPMCAYGKANGCPCSSASGRSDHSDAMFRPFRGLPHAWWYRSLRNEARQSYHDHDTPSDGLATSNPPGQDWDAVSTEKSSSLHSPLAQGSSTQHPLGAAACNGLPLYVQTAISAWLRWHWHRSSS